MKILLGADTYPEYISGAANFTVRLAQGLAGRGHRVSVIWPSADGAPRSYSEGGVDIHRLRSYSTRRAGGFRLCGHRSSATTIQAILDAVRPDIVHIQSHIIVGRKLAKAAAAAQYPLIATNHFMPENVLDHIPLLGRLPQTVSRWAWRDLAKVYGQADLVTAPTQRAVDLLETAAGLAAEAVSCGIDQDRYWEAGRTAPTNVIPTVLFVGRLETEKNVDELLRAFAGLPSPLPARLRIIGTGTQEHQLQALAQRLGLGSRVTFEGRVDDDQVTAAYGAADVFCIPGTAELQSLATLEAMSAGKPIIAANAMALPHLVKPDLNGYLYNPGDIETLTDQLAALLSQPALRRRMGNASSTLAAHHSLAATLDTFEARYARLHDAHTAAGVRTGGGYVHPTSGPSRHADIWRERGEQGIAA